ncbi:hypothetical protein GGG87_06425 [Streptococcus sp. zg-86]|uniref:1,4-dihydroxy-2-naphthoate prenyltransferase n=1 Tax=Streptococcus zhangguiae TaxID=2664091 RepID=A0A6I4RAZ6_9STRE|nr:MULTISPECIES: hypothetical protein [unclassified Streptococcus]MTB64627.1 hypothetical protein [Streptococcus sp. zg-86]MTB90937.1 hypothetical protein [Streptococcus sp. zg-36]MWV56639.1 hypothetical protein [Streptococcus sp. zg-70]QTH48598.1 hypothetical protein J5M87_04570 [Streptococcus sp. zg-86]
MTTEQSLLKERYRYLIYTGFVIWLSAFLPIPREWFWLTSWAAYATIFIVPTIGLVSLLLSIFYRKWWWMLVSILLIFSFPISYGLGYFLFGP